MAEDRDKSKESLIQELEELRLRVNRLMEAGESEYQRIAGELKKSEEIYRTVFNHSPDFIYLNDVDGFFLDANPAVLEVHGLSLGEFQKKSFLDFFAGDNLEELIRVSDGLKEGRPVYGLRLRTRTARGRILEMEINAVPLLENGKVVSVLSLARDITARVEAETKLKQAYEEMETKIAQRTVDLVKANQELRKEVSERKRTEAARQESEELYRTLVETSPNMIGLLDLEGRILFMNRRLKEAHGVQKEEDFIGRKVTDLMHPADREKAEANIRRANRGDFNRSNEYSIRLPDGSLATWETTSALIRDAGGRPKAILAINRDVTEQRKAEEALRDSEEMYRSLVETSPDVITVMDLEGRMLYASPMILETYGYQSEDEYLGKKISDLIAPEEREKVIANFRKSIQEGSLRGQEYTISRKDGIKITVESRSSIIRDASGKPKALLGITRDVTERKRAEEALRESEELYRTVVETSPDVITLLDLEGRITFATGKIKEMYGYKSEDEYLGKQVLVFVSPEDRERVQSNLMKSARLGSLRGNEYPILRKDGKLVVTEVSSAVIRDAHGKPKGMIAINRDVTERKRSEEALRESEEIYRTLVETSPDAIITTDLESRITGASQRALEIFRADRKEDLVGRMSFELTDSKEHQEIKRNIKKLQEARTVRNVERTFLRIDGTSFIGEISAAPLKDAGGAAKGLFITIRDITERKRMEKEILEIAARERRRIGHDLHDGLGQHLAAISFMNRVLENKLAAKSPAEAKAAARISRLISEAISQSRDLARGINPVEPKADGLMASLRQLTANLERIFKISCQFQCARKVLVSDNIVSTNLFYIAQEATSNAIKHGKAEHVKVSLAVVRNKLTLSVSDDGVGIPKNFSPNGGLGLQIMDYRSKIIGANLSIQPGRKGGTTVTCSLRAPGKSLH